MKKFVHTLTKRSIFWHIVKNTIKTINHRAFSQSTVCDKMEHFVWIKQENNHFVIRNLTQKLGKHSFIQFLENIKRKDRFTVRFFQLKYKNRKIPYWFLQKSTVLELPPLKMPILKHLKTTKNYLHLIF